VTIAFGRPWRFIVRLRNLRPDEDQQPENEWDGLLVDEDKP